MGFFLFISNIKTDLHQIIFFFYENETDCRFTTIIITMTSLKTDYQRQPSFFFF